MDDKMQNRVVSGGADVFRSIAEYSHQVHDPHEFVCKAQELPPMYNGDGQQTTKQKGGA